MDIPSFNELRRELPEYIPFTVPFLLCAREDVLKHGKLFGNLSFFDFPVSKGWTIYHQRESGPEFHPGATQNEAAPLQELEKLPSVPRDLALTYPPLSINFQLYKIGGDGGLSVARYEEQVAFLQEWMFFGVLLEVSRICGLELDIEKEFLIESTDRSGGQQIRVSTEPLRDLAQRWVESAWERVATPAAEAKITPHSDPENSDGEGEGGDDYSPSMGAITEEYQKLLVRVCDVLGFIDALHDPIYKGSRFGYIYEHVPYGHNVPRNESQEELSYDQLSVLMSIKILLRAVALMLLKSSACPGLKYHVSEKAVEGLVRSTEYLPLDLGYSETRKLVRTELLRRGWCPSEVAMLREFAVEHDREYLFYATRMERPKVDHGGCDDLRCFANDVDETKYETAHSSPGCACAHVTVNVDDVVAVLSKEDIPVVLISENLELSVVSRRSGPYVAISHVWSQGLGNPVQNSLPLCQIRRLRDYVSRVSDEVHDGSVAIWIDTLCIPVPRELKAFRRKAISLLGITFEDATVLVLDKDLETLEMQGATIMEVNLRLCCSGWMSRLWTLQEGMLSGELWIQFRDVPARWSRPAPYPGGYHITQTPPHRRWGKSAAFQMIVDNRVPVAETLRVPEHHMGMISRRTNFSRLVAAVKFRCTSKMEDEPIILAHIMGLDVKKLMAAPDKMAAFYVGLEYVPGDLIFLDLNGKTLQDAPFRWAPSTLLGPQIQDSMMPFDTLVGRCDERGLHMQCGGLVFTKNSVEILQAQPEFSLEEITYKHGSHDVLLTLVAPRGKEPVKWPGRPALLTQGPLAVLVDILHNGWTGAEEGQDTVEELVAKGHEIAGETTVAIVAYGVLRVMNTNIPIIPGTDLAFEGDPSMFLKQERPLPDTPRLELEVAPIHFCSWLVT